MQIIHQVEAIRNRLIYELLDESNLVRFAKEHFHATNLSQLTKSLIEQEFRSLLVSHLDLDHYSNLIRQIEKDPEAVDGLEKSPLFAIEIANSLNKYFYK